MAKRLNYEIGFTGDTKQLETAINHVVESLNQIGLQGFTSMKKDMQEGAQAALQLSNYLQKAYNSNTGKLDLSAFNDSLKASGLNISQYADKLASLGGAGKQAFLEVAQAIGQAELPLRRSGNLLNELWTTMKNTMRWQLTSSMLHGFMGAVSTAYGYTKDLNESLNSIRIVTQKSAEDMAKFAEQANKAAKTLSTTTTRYTDASLIYYQQGLDDEAVKARTDVTIKLANAAGESAETASEQLTAIWNNFAEGSENLEHYADVLTALGATTASSTQEISQGLEKFAAIADTVGLSYEYAAAALATVTATTRQSADVVGTAFRTLFGRMESLKLGETLDDGTTLNKYSQALESVGVSIKNANGELKNMDDILDETMAKWETLTRDQQVALSQTVAGVRQYSQFIALMDNAAFFQENLQTARNSEGTLDQQAKIFEESWEAARNRVRAATEDLYDSLIDEESFIALDNVIEKILTNIAKVIDGFGGMKGVLSGLSTLFLTIYSDKIAQSLRNTAFNVRSLLGLESERARLLQSETVKEVEKLQNSYQDNIFMKDKLEIMKEQVLIQGILNENEGKYSSEQLEQIKNEQTILTLLQKQAEQKAENAYNANENYQTEKGWMNLSTAGASVLREEARERVQDYRSNNKMRQGISVLDTNTKTLNKIFSDNDLRTTEIYDQLINEFERAKNAAFEFEKISQTVKENSEQDWLSLAKTLGLTANSSEVAKDKIKELLEQGKDNVLYHNLTSVKEALKAIVDNPRDIDTLEKLYTETLRATASEEQAMEAVRVKAEQLKNSVKDISEGTKDWAANATAVAQGLSSLSMGINSLGSLFDTFEDNTLTLEDQIPRVVGSLGMLIPLFIKAGTTIKAAGSLTAVFTGSLAAAMPVIVAIGVALYGAYRAFDLFTESTEEARERLKGLRNEFEEITSNISSMESSLEQLKSKLEELKKVESPTIVEEEEITKLEKEIALQERAIELENYRKKESAKENGKAIEETWSKLTKDFTENQLAITNLLNSAERQQQSIQWRELAYKNLTELAPSMSDEEEKEQLKLINKTVQDWQNGTYQNYEELYQALSLASSQVLKEYSTKFPSPEEINKKYREDNEEALKSLEENYANLIENIQDGYEIDPKSLEEKQKDLAEKRNKAYQQDYEKLFLAPITKAINLDNLLPAIFDSEQFGKALTDIQKQFLDKSGVSVEDYRKYLEDGLNRFSSIFTNKDELANFFKNLPPDALNAALQLGDSTIENISTVKELTDEIAKKLVEIQGVSFNFDTATASAYDALEKIRQGKFLDEETLTTLKDQFKDIFDLGNIEELPLNDQLSLIQAALDTAFDPAVLKQRIEELREEIKEFEKDTSKDHQLEISYNNQSIKELEKVLDDLFNNPYQIQLELDTSVTNRIAAEMGVIRKAVSLISNDFQVEAKNVADLAKTLPEIFKNATVGVNEAGQQVIQLNKTTIEEIGNIYQATTEASRQSQLARLEGELTTASTTLSILQAAAADEISLSEGVTREKLINLGYQENDVDNAVKNIVKLRLIQKIRENAASKDTLTQQEADVKTNANAHASMTKINAANSKKSAISMATDYHNALAAMDKDRKDWLAQKSLNQIGQRAIGEGYRTNYSSALSYETITGPSSVDTSKEEAAIEAIFDANGNIAEAAKLLGTSIHDAREIIAEAFETAGIEVGTVAKGEQAGNRDITSAFENILKNNSSLFDNLSAEQRSSLAGLGEENVSNLAKLMAKLLEDGSFNDFLNGKTKSGSGGSGSSKKLSDKDLERYHEITREIQRQSELLDKLSTQADRAYGVARLKEYEKELKNLEKQESLYRQKAIEAQGYLEKDRANLINLNSNFGLGIRFGASGDISNYTKMLTDLTTRYQNGGISEEDYNKIMNVIKHYEDSLDTRKENLQLAHEIAMQIQDKKLNTINYKIELALDIRDVREQVNNISKAISESYGDAITHSLSVFKLDTSNALGEIEMVQKYQETAEELNALMDDWSTNTNDLIEAQKNLISNLGDSVDALLEWMNYWESMLPDAISAASERLNEFTDQLNHNTSILETIKELYALQGQTYKTAEGFRRLQQVSQERLNAQLSTAIINRNWFNELRANLEKAQAALDSLNGNENDARWDAFKANRDALLAEYNAAEEAYLSSAKEAMESAKAMYEEQLEKAAYDFAQAVAGQDLDFLSERYDHFIDQEERYLDAVNTAYEKQSWYNRIQKDIDNDANGIYKDRLELFYQQEVEQRALNGLNKYDLDIIEAKYKVLQAQMALEEAQNNATEMRLVRNSQGNWTYRFSADPDAIADAEKNLADAQNDWYNIAKDQVTDVTGEIIKTWEEAQEAIKAIYEDMTLTDQERADKAAEIYDYYVKKIEDLEREKQIAIADMTEAGALTISNFQNTYAETLSGMTTSNQDFAIALQDYMQQCQDSLNGFNETVNMVAEESGSDLTSLDEKVKDIAESTENMENAGVSAAAALGRTITTIQNVALAYASLAEEVEAAYQAMRDLAMLQGENVEEVANRVEYDPNKDYSREMANLYQQYGASAFEREDFKQLERERQAKIDRENIVDALTNEQIKEMLLRGFEGIYFTLEEYRRIMGLATGGYTGAWGPSGKLALLHEKELVLNQEDTANILAATEIMRAIVHTLDNGANMATGNMAALLTGGRPFETANSSIATTNYFNVSFPNAVYASEIEEALNSLISNAEQYASDGGV